MNKKSKYLALILLILIIAIATTVTIATVNIVVHINKIKAIESEKTEMTYQVNSVSGDNMDITIKIKNRYGIDKVITPDGREILSHGRTRLGIDYKVIDGQTYYVDLQIKGTTSLQRYTLNATKENKINITETQAYAYPLLTEYGVELNKYVQIDYGDNEDNYYSIDDGQTWNKYEGTIGIHKDCTLIAKSITDDISKEISKEIKLNLASDALGTNAYDGNIDTYDEFGSWTCKYIYFDETIRGKKIYIKYDDFAESGRYPYIYLYKTDGSSESIGTYSDGRWKLNIEYLGVLPENAAYLYFATSSYGGSRSIFRIHEIKTANEPTIEVTQHWPVLKSTGVSATYNTAKINYFNTSVQKLYKINDEEWKEYVSPIDIKIGDILYAKGIDVNGVETRIVSQYTSTTTGDALGVKAYDGNNSTYESFSGSRILYIDENMIGKNFYFLIDSAVDTSDWAYVRLYKTDGSYTTLYGRTSWPGDSNWSYTGTIPTDASYLWFGARRSISVREVKPTN